MKQDVSARRAPNGAGKTLPRKAPRVRLGEMKRALMWGVIGLAIAHGLRAADEAFSKTVSPADFSAAGLGSLSAEELARLDGLVRDFKSGALEAARREAEVSAAARAEAEARAAKAEAQARLVEAEGKKNATNLLARAKVRLTPGTEIEYATVESRIAGEFRGWSGKTVFALENGQRWQVDGTSAYVSSPIASPAVKITPGMLGSFWMNVDGVRTRVKVKPVGTN